MKNSAIMTGLLRSEEDFRTTVKTLVRWKSEGLLENIILSTWIGELDDRDDLIDFLNENDIGVLESAPPPFKSPGNIIHQMKAIHVALQFCSDESYILKCRTDRSELHYQIGHPHFQRSQYVRQLLGGFRPVEKKLENWPDILDDRFYLRLGRLNYPFYLRDMIVYAKGGDMRQIVNFDLGPAALLGNFANSAEILFFSQPFLKRFPILQEYLHQASPCPRRYIHPQTGCAYEKEAIDQMPELELLDPFASKALATYVLILHKYFHLGINLQQDQPKPGIPITRIFSGELEPHTGPGKTDTLSSAAINSQSLIRYLVEKRFLMDDAGLSFSQALDAVSDFTFHRSYKYNPFLPSQEAMEYREKLQKKLNTYERIERFRVADPDALATPKSRYLDY